MHRTRETVALVCRVAAGGVLLWAGLAKGLDRQGTILAVDAFDVLPAALVRPVAAALPWVEVTIGAFLVLGLFVRFSGVLTAGLALAFVAALSQAKARGLAIDCGCFGGGGAGSGVTWFDVVRDLPLALAGAYLVFVPGRWLRLDRLWTREEERHESLADAEGREAPHPEDGDRAPALVGPAEG
jgi:uncharacterized membrane protein YphA (DoxX/SURF4 family)